MSGTYKLSKKVGSRTCLLLCGVMFSFNKTALELRRPAYIENVSTVQALL